MIRLMLRAAGLAPASRPTGRPAAAPTPEEQLRRFAALCERLPDDDDERAETRLAEAHPAALKPGF